MGIKLYPEHVGVFTTVMKQQFVAFGVNAQGISTNITEQVGWEGATGRTIRKSEDLSEIRKDVSVDKGQTCVICG